MLRPNKSLLFILLLSLLSITVPGCIETIAQRISVNYDQKNDVLNMLIFYDGVYYTSGMSLRNNNKPDADTMKNDLDRFIKLKKVMIGHTLATFDKSTLKNILGNNENMPPRRKVFLNRTLESIAVEFHSHYRTAKGQIGMVQHVKISNASKWVKSMNDMLNEFIIEERAKAPDRAMELYPQLAKLWLKAAEAGHQWISLKGQSIKLNVPIHKGEWAAFKAAALAQGLDWIYKKGGRDEADRTSPKSNIVLAISQMLTSVPMSYTETNREVAVVIGAWDVPNTFRMKIDENKTYQPNLVEHMPELLPERLYDRVNKALKDQANAGAIDKMILQWGPPEVQARALYELVQTQTGDAQQQTMKRLDTWAEKWNSEHSFPTASVHSKSNRSVDGHLKVWRAWFALMEMYPNGILEQQER